MSGYASTEGASDEILAIYGHDLQHIRMAHFTSRPRQSEDFLSKVPGESVIMPYGLPLVNLQAWVSDGVLVEDDEQIDDMNDE